MHCDAIRTTDNMYWVVYFFFAKLCINIFNLTWVVTFIADIISISIKNLNTAYAHKCYKIKTQLIAKCTQRALCISLEWMHRYSQNCAENCRNRRFSFNNAISHWTLCLWMPLCVIFFTANIRYAAIRHDISMSRFSFLQHRHKVGDLRFAI
jgi:hypothetical protein